MIVLILYLASVVISLYAAYLFSFCTYDKDGQHMELKRYSRITYLGVFVLAIIPLFNIGFTVAFWISAIDEHEDIRGIYVKSWWLDRPGTNEEPDRGSAKKRRHEATLKPGNNETKKIKQNKT